MLRQAIRMAALATLTSPAAFGQGPAYQVTDLGRASGYTYSTVPLALNNLGEVVGFVQGGAETRAFICRAATGLELLPLPAGHTSTAAVDINDHGDIVGYAGVSDGVNQFGWLYRDGRYTMLGTRPGFRGSIPGAINNNGEVLGSVTPFSLTNPGDNFYWSEASGMIDPTPGATATMNDLNDAGVVAGGGVGGVTTWDLRTGEVTVLGTLPDPFNDAARALSINESGGLAGTSTWVASSSTRLHHAFVSDGEEGVLGDIGGIGASERHTAYAINEHGEVAGYSAYNSSNIDHYAWVYLPEHGVRRLLEALERPADWNSIHGARGINDRGQVIAGGSRANGPDPFRRGLLLTPIVPCPADFNGDGTLDSTDVFAYLAAFFDASPDADVNQDGVVVSDDFFSFLAAYFDGC